MTYEAGISTGGFENLGVRDFLKYNKDAEILSKTEYYGYQEGTGFLYNLQLTAPTFEETIDRTP